MTDTELARLDPAIVRVSLDPRIGTAAEGRLEREYRSGGVRIVYIPTVLGTLIIVAYVEVD
ncbi:hypothetical protein [Streptomyces sp. H27-C3]|uniref:hypothetical protein n=1 Tax=Streptomyces sp. H27-C3 TaxID=3046305 RepID=UPI0024BB8F7E|nr:hypothetical protein [Streptomyces sp. H27-C3]MDJ0466802.1 hypothetical protein [Streptomyces sp. H27-C3]